MPRSKKRWSSASRSRSLYPRRAGSRTLKGHVEDLSNLSFKTDDKLGFAFFAETTSKLLLFATNGKFYSLDVAKLPGGRGHGEPIRLFIDIEQDAAIVSLFVHTGGRKFLIASHEGQGFVVNEDDCVGTTRKGKQVLNVEMPNEAKAIVTVAGDQVAVIGTNHKMVIFPLDQVPEMARGRGVRLQKYKDGRAVRRRRVRFENRIDVEGLRGPRAGLELEGLVRVARQPRRRRTPRARPTEIEQVRPNHMTSG